MANVPLSYFGTERSLQDSNNIFKQDIVSLLSDVLSSPVAPPTWPL